LYDRTKHGALLALENLTMVFPIVAAALMRSIEF
jgi:hypothetical protein